MSARRVSEELRLAAANPASPLIPPVPEWDVCTECGEAGPDVTLRSYLGEVPFYACDACNPATTPRYERPRRAPLWKRGK